jgi:hypothetical protein
MRFSSLAVWLGIAVAVAVILVLISDIPLWAAALIAVFAVIANMLVTRVEDGDGEAHVPFGELPLGKRVLRVTLRVAGALIGIGTIATGVLVLGDPPSPTTWWRSYGVPVGIMITGAYFLMYGVTGRSKLLSGRRDRP